MTADLLYCCKVQDFSEDYSLTLEFLSTLDIFVGTWESREEKTVFHTLYATDPATTRQAMVQLEEQMPMWADFGIKLGELEYFELPKEDWTEVWKKYFHILHIAPNLTIRPSWIDYEAKVGETVVDIDPGMSFGTGQHATTAFCLRQLAEFAGDQSIERVLDAGCGSGILAIAAAKLNFPVIDAFDYDPDAVMVSEENIEKNHLTGKINLFQGDAIVYEPVEQYDLALVNILGHILKANRHRIISWVKPGKYLALAGILNEEFDALSAAFVEAGAEEICRGTEKEWTSGLFRIPER